MKAALSGAPHVARMRSKMGLVCTCIARRAGRNGATDAAGAVEGVQVNVNEGIVAEAATLEAVFWSTILVTKTWRLQPTANHLGMAPAKSFTVAG